MATPADQRLLELLDSWLSSLELHLKYLSLDDDSYAKIQAWPKHQRPTRWILDLAKQRALALRAQIQERIQSGDAKFSDSLEAMSFLANLVGSQHIERFIPLAESAPVAPASATSAELATIAMPITLSTAEPSATAVTGTREMPQFVATQTRQPPPAGNAQVARAERKAARPPPVPPKPQKPTAAPAPKPAPKIVRTASKPPARVPAERPATSSAAREQVIADAERLLQWGRKWYELAELIARMADRPPLPDVRRILKEHKAALDKKRDDG
jgi:hypothetical protein